MSSPPAAGYWSNAARTVPEGQQVVEDVRNVLVELPGGGVETTLTISGGSVTPGEGAARIFSIETEAGAATDDLTNIVQTECPDGCVIGIRALNAAHVPTAKASAGGAGQLSLRGGLDLALTATSKILWLKRTGSLWEELVPATCDLRTVRALIANTTLVPGDSGATITNTASTADRVHTMPAATVGLRFRVRVTVAFKIKLNAVGTDTIRDDDGTTVSAAAGGTEIAAVIGNLFDIECFETGKWVVTAARGTLSTA